MLRANRRDEMKKDLVLLTCILLLASCSAAPSADTVATLVAATVAAQQVSSTVAPQPTDTTVPATIQESTSTPEPTSTQAPIGTSTASRIELLRTNLPLVVTALLEEGAKKGINDIEKVNMVRIANGRLEIEVTTKWASQDEQPVVTSDIVQYSLTSLVNFTAKELADIVESDEFSVYLVTYSTNGDYRYESTTNYDTLLQVKDRSISYGEWIEISNAGFR